MKPKSRSPRDIGFYILVFIILVSAVYLLLSNQGSGGTSVDYSDVRRLFMDDKVTSFNIKENTLTMKLKENYDDTGSDIVTHQLYDVNLFYADMGDTITKKLQLDPNFKYNYDVGWQAPWWFSLLPYAIVIILFIVLWNAMMNRSGVGGDKSVIKFGKARTRLASEEKKKVTFADVAGADEEKEELREIVDFLKGPQKYISLGARIPKGVLLVGPPGTGKTLLAKAVAGEAGVQFLSISGSDFVELYVGVGASRVRDLFDQAKKLAPAIIFIDEIDAVGRQRGAGLGGGHDEREQTLNQLLVEMDGFTTNEGVIVMAATNRSDILDSALLRPGRFDRQVYVGLPDIKGREAILRVHARGKVLGDDVDLASIAKGTPGFTGADLENLLNEAALLAARYNKRFITMQEIEAATLKVIAGPEKRSRVVTEKDRKLTAFHEAGHAVVSNYLEHVDPVHQITIIPHGQAGGMTIYRPVEDKTFNSRSEMFERIVSALGGRMAEKIMLNDISTGASGDIQSASAIARSMVTKYGMSDKIGPISFDDSSHSVFIGRDFSQTKSYSEKTAAIIDDEVKHIFDEAMQKCEEILLAHKDILIKTAEYLLENETMDGDDFRYLCQHNGELPPKKEKPHAPENQDGVYVELTKDSQQPYGDVPDNIFYPGKKDGSPDKQ
ncbi:cell division protease FtsH [Sporobacter termitidis DSM 10068]|uniref:ATP-dependent zinc metalloprotease FtsH n=1 Tax=Sporobacter termitidis DSM 10068 TaxID=1123282 RepID=A0A1M5Y6B7_9FIRM|nr:ATP-dependent zinc metalloprotease FtsH [Sporobacter termitidis]SHI07597.1 cell division protease FtsH [Sporobacter termitidis DSM 10068]